MSNKKVEPLSHYRGLPQDLWPKKVWIGEPGAEVAGLPEGYDRSAPPPYIYGGVYVGRGFIGRTVTVLTEPTLILACDRSWPYLLVNPAKSVGLTTSGVLVPSTTINAAGNSQATPIGCANYMQAHFHLIVTACAGTYDFNLQERDPISGRWIDTQVIFGGVNAAGDYYATVGNIGVVIDMAVRWAQTAAGAITFTMNYTFKEGTIGSSSGLSQIVYIGPNQDVNLTNGYPILEGQQQTFIVGDNTDIWGIAEVETPIKVFQL